MRVLLVDGNYRVGVKWVYMEQISGTEARECEGRIPTQRAGKSNIANRKRVDLAFKIKASRCICYVL